MLAITMARSHNDLVDLAKFPERSMARTTTTTTTVPGSRIPCMRRMSSESGASRDGTTVVSTNERVQPRLLPQPLPMMVSQGRQGRPCSAMPTQRSVVALCWLQGADRYPCVSDCLPLSKVHMSQQRKHSPACHQNTQRNTS